MVNMPPSRPVIPPVPTIPPSGTPTSFSEVLDNVIESVGLAILLTILVSLGVAAMYGEDYSGAIKCFCIASAAWPIWLCIWKPIRSLTSCRSRCLWIGTLGALLGIGGAYFLTQKTIAIQAQKVADKIRLELDKNDLDNPKRMAVLAKMRQQTSTQISSPVEPLRFTVSSVHGRYQPNISVAGIKWKENYTDARMYLINAGHSDYMNVDLVVTSSRSIFEMRSIAGCQDPVIARVVPAVAVSSKNVPGGIWTPGEAMKMVSNDYHVHCGLISPGEAEFIMAVSKDEDHRLETNVKGYYYDFNGHKREFYQGVPDMPTTLP